ncbi:MAG: hypothetical protein LC796_00335 [Acidobacteria bacterium]|nr:hypothetical protein [Acidobacteriota bacterium]MCA1609447.1 hypothetical protein [Acidobacteriota bacterium]
MKLRLIGLATLVILVSATASATTFALSSAVTGSPNPATTGVDFNIAANRIFEVMGVIPVVSTVTATPASMAASVWQRDARLQQRAVGGAVDDRLRAHRDPGGQRLSGGEPATRQHVRDFRRDPAPLPGGPDDGLVHFRDPPAADLGAALLKEFSVGSLQL